MDNHRKKKITRREFIKTTAMTTAAVGITSTFPGFLKRAAAARRDHILIGRVQPTTGPMAAFAEPSPWVDNLALKEINKNGGIYIEEAGKKLPIKIKTLDTQSDSTKAAEAASKLILKDKVDMMYASHAPGTVNPVALICERFKVPCLGDNLPAEMFLPDSKHYWSFSAGGKVGDFMASYIDMWGQINTNKVVGLLAANETDGVAFADGCNAMLPTLGYKIVDSGRFPPGNMDFSSTIDDYKRNNVEIIFGNLNPPDFARVWRQCFQMNFLPKICTIGRAVLFPSAVESLGEDLGLGVTGEAIWHPSFPFESTLGGIVSQDLANAYETEFGKQWTEPIGMVYGGFEIIADALKRAKTLDREKLRNAFAATNLVTICGPVQFNGQNTVVYPSCAQQWVKGTKYKYDSRVVSVGNYKNIMKPDGKLLSLEDIRSK